MPFVGLGNREFGSISVHQEPFVRGLPEYGITNSLWICTLPSLAKLYIYRCFFIKYIACGNKSVKLRYTYVLTVKGVDLNKFC